jgi:hypothetical protein
MARGYTHAAVAAFLAAALLALAPMAAARTPRPDLRVSAVSSGAATLAAGGALPVVDRTVNRGNARTAASVTRYYLSLNGARDRSDVRLLGQRRVPALDAGKASRGSASVTAPAFIAAASYRLLACADDLRKRREGNEANNCRAAAGRVAVSPVSSGVGGGLPEGGDGSGGGGTAGDSSGSGTGTGNGGTPPGGGSPPPPQPPGAPTNVGALPVSAEQVNLSWSGVSGATAYRVLRSTTSGGPYAEVATPITTSFSDTGLSSNTTYFYVVQATNADGSSPNSAERIATTDFVCTDAGANDVPGGATNLGTVNGDTASGSGPITSSTSVCRGDVDWYSVQVAENSSSDVDLTSEFALSMAPAPQGSSNRDLDLCVFRFSAADPSPACSENAGTVDELVRMRAEDDHFPAPSDDTATLLVRVEGASSSTLNTYTLTVTGNVACGMECHLYNP